MRVHLLLILFFVSIVSARARNTRNVDEINLLANPTNEGSNEKIVAKRSVDDLPSAIWNLMESILSLVRIFLSIPSNALKSITEHVLRVAEDAIPGICKTFTNLPFCNSGSSGSS